MALSLSLPSRAADFSGGLSLDSTYTSNIFLDASHEWDVVLRPQAELGLDFADTWSVGYTGEANVFAEHPKLFSHFHEVYLFYNPAWGEDGENEFTSEVRLQTLLNTRSFRDINLLHPAWLNKLELQPQKWLRAEFSLDTSYLWFFEDSSSSSIDVWARARLSFQLPSRTSISPLLRYGLRWLTQPLSTTTGEPDRLDQQLVIGLQLGQGLWEGAGLQVQGSFLPDLGTSALLSQKLAQAQFVYLGEEFLYSGWQAALALRQVIGVSWMFEAGCAFERRTYSGWPALDASGASIGEDRTDTRVIPRLSVQYRWRAEKDGATISDFGVDLDAAWMLQGSNSDWYDTDAMFVALSLNLGF
ncbi:MAG: hypothetical protein GYA21_05170 [Myxococcales bacterium]|nr:hypothetical protein [Myxococcales bacterium]